MIVNHAADSALATIGAVLWSLQVVPQIIKSYRTKSTEGLSPALMFIWGCASIFQAAYLVSQHSSIPLQIQPHVFGSLGVVSWAQCLYYGSKFSKWKSIACMCAFYVVFAGFEVGSVFALWAGRDNGFEWPVQMYGWITSALLACGLLPQYWEIYKHKEVIGISIMFMMVDIWGGLFSAVSLFFRETFDSTAFVQYMLVVVLDGLVVVLAMILNPMAKRRRAREALKDDEESSAESPADSTGGDSTISRVLSSGSIVPEVGGVGGGRGGIPGGSAEKYYELEHKRSHSLQLTRSSSPCNDKTAPRTISSELGITVEEK